MGEGIKDNESVYDEQIAPLMKQIIAICKEHSIPMLATFVYAPEQFCTTSLPVDHFYPEDKAGDEHKAMMEAYQAIRRSPEVFAFTITSGPKP